MAEHGPGAKPKSLFVLANQRTAEGVVGAVGGGVGGLDAHDRGGEAAGLGYEEGFFDDGVLFREDVEVVHRFGGLHVAVALRGVAEAAAVPIDVPPAVMA